MTQPDDDSADSVDSIDTVESSSEDSTLIGSDSEAPDEAATAGPDPAAEVSPAVLSHQARAVREASERGRVWLEEAIAANEVKRAMMVLSVAPYLLNEPLSNGETPLLMAVSQGHAKLVERLLQCDGIDPNKPGARGWTPLCMAAQKNQIAIAQRLLRAGADIHQARRDGFTPLHAAAHAGHTDMVRWLLQQPALWQSGSSGAGPLGPPHGEAEVLNPRTSRGQTPLILAIAQGKLDVVQLLLEQDGIDPNLVDDDDLGALHHAATHGHTEVVRSLLKLPDTEVDCHGPKCLPALFYALIHNQLDAAALLLHGGANIHWQAPDNARVLDAMVHADASTVRWLLKRRELVHQNGKFVGIKAVLNRSGSDGVTLLQNAAFKGNLRLVQRLLSLSADPNQADTEGWTPLARAIEQGHLDTAQLLLPLRKAGIDEPLPTGNTLLCVALASGQLAIAAWLGRQGASVLKANQDGDTPWHVACEQGTAAARWLKNEAHRQLGIRSSDVFNARDAQGATALQKAAGKNALELVRFLLKQTRIDVNLPDKDGWAPLHLAAREGARDTLLELLAHPRIDLHQKGPQGKNLLHCAAMSVFPRSLLDTIQAHLPAAQFQLLKETCDDFQSFPVSTAAEQGAGRAVLDILHPGDLPLPPLQTRTHFQQGWILEGYDCNSRKSWADLGTKAGIRMHAIGDGDGGEALTIQKLKQLKLQPGDFVIVSAHSGWNAKLKCVTMELSDGIEVPLVEIARLLFERGVLKVLFLGCEVNMALAGLRNRLTHDPLLWRPGKGLTALEDLDYTLVGRKGEVAHHLDDRAATLCLEDCAARRPDAQAADGALFNRSVQPMRTLGWNASEGRITVRRRSRLKPNRLDHLHPDDARRARVELLQLSAFDGRVKETEALLLRHQVDVNARGLYGVTPLMHAITFDRPEMIKLLLTHNADVHLVDDGRRSALWHACSEGNAMAVQALLAAGADPHSKDVRGDSAWDVAHRKGHTAILKLLPSPPAATVTRTPSPP